MKPERIKALLPMLGSKAIGNRTGWVLATCPLRWKHGTTPSEAFAISTDPKKKSRCKCLSCGYSGDLTDLLLDIQFGLRKNPEYRTRFNLLAASQVVAAEFTEMELTAADIPDFETPLEKQETLFPEQWLATFRPVSDFPEAMTHCQKRGLNQWVLKYMDVRFDPQQRRVCFPFRNFRRELMGLQGRHIDPIQFKDKDHPDAPLRYFHYGYSGKRNLHCWLGEDKVDLDKPVVVCEGPFDYAKIAMAYPNVVASFTSGLSRTKVRRIADATEIFTFYDQGHGGDSARDAFEKYLPHHPMMHVIPSEEEGDAGNMSVEDIRACLKDHVQLP